MLEDNKKYNNSVKPNTAKLDELKCKIPEYFTKDGEFDFGKFKFDLQENNINELKSGYQLDFIGKDYAKKQAGEKPNTVIVPDKSHNEKSENKNSGNLFLTGDNLEILRHLQSNYHNKIDFIYIDPPYNTGSDGFVYPDKFEYKDEQLKSMFNLDETSLKRLKSIQGKSTHSSWLTFMYPRLFLAKRLLTDNGVIFISIDDNEQANLKLLMDMIFGEGNFIGNIAWESKTKSQNTKDAFDKLQPRVEHIFVYEKYKHRHFNLISLNKKEYNLKDEKGEYREVIIEQMAADGQRGRATMIFPIKGILPFEGKQWKLGQETIKNFEKRGDVFIKKGRPYLKKRPGDERQEETQPFWAFFGKNIGTAESAKKEVKKYFQNQSVFDTVKPVELIKRLIMHGSEKDSIILDFFAGSSTTAEAVMQLNAEDNGNRKFIMATLPEPTYKFDENNVKKPTKGGGIAFKAGFERIDKISRERIIKAAKKINGENSFDSLDLGFKHYRFVPPRFKKIDEIEFNDVKQLNLFDDSISPYSSLALTKSHLETNFENDFPWHDYDLGDKTDGEDTILLTWLVADGFKFDENYELIDFEGYIAPLVDNSRVYLIGEGWNYLNTKELVNRIGTREIIVQTIIVYGYSFTFESLRELELALKQLDNKVNLIVRY